MLNRRMVWVAVLGVFASGLSAQKTAMPAISTTKEGAGAEQQDYRLRLDVRRVPINVVVTDKDGKPVRGLKKDDFILKEDNVVQSIHSFDYFDGTVATPTPPKLPPLPDNTFVNLPTTAEHGPLYVLYYDMVNTNQTDQMSAHQQLLDFVDHAQPGTRFALFVNASGLHLIQGFTSDHALLHSAILSKGPGPHVPDVFIYGENYGRGDAGGALNCLKFIADYLNGIPGRKNLLWLSSIFPIPVGPTLIGPNVNTGVSGGFSSSTLQINDLTYLLSETIKKAYSAMMRSQVALYPIDLAGQNPENSAGDQIVNGTQDSAIAAATGGHAYYGGNRLKTMLDKAVENGESYYTLSYAPSNSKYDGSARAVEVKLANAKKDQYTLSYRSLYYAVSDDQVQDLNKKDVAQSQFMAAKTADTLYANIEHGAPAVRDLLFGAHLSAPGPAVLASAQQMLQLEDSPAFFRTRKKNKPAKPLAPVKLQKYVIDYGVFDPKLKALAREGGKPAMLEFAAAAYDDDGRLLNSMLNEGLASMGSDAEGKPKGLFHAEQELWVPPGAVWIRLAVRDKLSDRTGTLEVKLPLRAEQMSASAAKP